MATNPEYPDLAWRPPKSYSKGRPEGPPRLIVIHYTAGHEGYDDAENGAAYDMRRTDGTSSHYYVDADSVVQCVATWDRSHTALYHGNMHGIHYELCGTAQNRNQWLDLISRATIRNAARQIVRDMRKYDIPLKRITGIQVRPASAKGICGHVDCTNGWPEDKGTHTDPGTSFPWDVLFQDIEEFLGGDDMDPKTPITVSKEVKVPGLPDGFTRPLEWWLPAIYAHVLGDEATGRQTATQVAALTAAVQALAESQGQDPEAVLDAVERGANKAVHDALRDGVGLPPQAQG